MQPATIGLTGAGQINERSNEGSLARPIEFIIIQPFTSLAQHGICCPRRKPTLDCTRNRNEHQSLNDNPYDKTVKTLSLKSAFEVEDEPANPNGNHQ